MDEPIELAIESPDGIADCRLEPERNEGVLSYSVTILYPHVVNGFSSSEVYCHHLILQPATGNYIFEEEMVHPKIRKLEAQLSELLTRFLQK